MGVDLRSPEEKLEAAKLKLKMMKSLGANSNKLKAGLFGNRKLNPNLPPTLGKDEGINLPPSHSPEMQEALDLDEAETLNRVKLESSMRGETILTKAASSAPLYAVMNLISYGASISKTNAVARASRRVSESSSSEANLTNKEERKEKEQSGTVEALIVERYLKAAEESATGYKKGLNCSENRLQRLRDLQVNAKRLKKQLNLEVSEYTNRERARQY